MAWPWPEVIPARVIPEDTNSQCWKPAVIWRDTHLQQVTEFVGDSSHVREAALNLGLCLLSPESLAKQFAAVTLQGRDP